MNPGTIKKYLTEIQNQILLMLKKQILHHKTHPIFLICKIFREKFGAAYKKYVQPNKTESGVTDRVGLIKTFKEKSKALQTRFNKKMEDERN